MNIFLYCNVQSSMTIKDVKNLWIAIKMDGTILTAWCSCMAGQSESCNHIVAALYKIEYVVIDEFTKPSCTSMPCLWNRSTKRKVTPMLIKDIVVRKKERKTGEGETREAKRQLSRQM